MNPRIYAAAGAALLASCASQMYWNRADTPLRQTAADLSECRVQANSGGQKVFSPQELEQPCMMAKGYDLTNYPPKP